MTVRHTIIALLIMGGPLTTSTAQPQSTSHIVAVQETLPTYRQPSHPVEERVADLLARMTTEEKVAQLCCPMGWEMYDKTGDDAVVPSERFKQLMVQAPIGALWAVLRADPWTKKTLKTGLNPKLAAQTLNRLQRFAVEQTRLGIPILFAEEAPHGHMAIGTTVFPTGLCCASTWNSALLERMGDAIGREVRAQGATVGYGPVLDVAREPRWSRMEETFGEDPWLTAIMGTAVMRGMQGDQLDEQHVGCTLKHLAAYGVPEGGHNGGAVYVGERQLRGQLLLPFERAVKEGAATVMTSYNAIDGLPCTANPHLLTDILRGEWGFRGFAFSDLFAIEGIKGMGAAASVGESAARALGSGLDMDLGGQAFGNHLKTLLQQGRISLKEIDRAVENVLRLKFKLGLFENPYADEDNAAATCRTEAHLNIALQVAEEGTVLLKNDGVLPLSHSMKRIAVIGPNADTPYNQLGDYTAPQPREAVSTLLDGIRHNVGSQTEVVYAKGCAIRDTTTADMEAAVRAAEQADAVVMAVGGSSARDFRTQYIATGAAVASAEVLDMDCGEGFDRATLSLLGKQEELIEAVASVAHHRHIPLVIVYIGGRPLLMNKAAEQANALLTAWYPGEQGGEAIARILFGDTNPSGRLPVSIPRSEGQLPVYYSQGLPRDYMDCAASPLYPFGYGLSYTTFSYSDLQIVRTDSLHTPYSTSAASSETNVMAANEVKRTDKGLLLAGSPAVAKVKVNVKNTGQREGSEVVQLYIHHHATSVAQPPLLLRAFEKVRLQPGESRTVEFTLGFDELSFIGQDMKRVLERGLIDILVGASSQDIRQKGVLEL